MSKPTLVMVPGMGADERLFEEQRAAFPDLVVPQWITPGRREPLREYAKRLAESVRVEGPVWLGGVSMGGMMALEMAKWLPGARGVFMIASCRCCSVIPGPMHAMEVWGRIMPNFVVEMLRRRRGFVLGKGNGLSEAQMQRFMGMYTSIPMSFFRWSAWAVLHWSYEGESPVRVHQIHGDRDGLMPVGKLTCKPDEVIEGGGHLINMSHADRVNAFMRERMG